MSKMEIRLPKTYFEDQIQITKLYVFEDENCVHLRVQDTFGRFIKVFKNLTMLKWKLLSI